MIRQRTFAADPACDNLDRHELHRLLRPRAVAIGALMLDAERLL
jgi:hypothetical protein